MYWFLVSIFCLLSSICVLFIVPKNSKVIVGTLYLDENDDIIEVVPRRSLNGEDDVQQQQLDKEFNVVQFGNREEEEEEGIDESKEQDNEQDIQDGIDTDDEDDY